MGSGISYGGGLFGAIGNVGADIYEGVTGVHSAKTRREGRRKKAEGKLTTKMFGDNLIKSKADEERMGRLEGDMQSKLALARGKQTDEAENYTMVSNALENAKKAGAGKDAIARIAGMARGQAARAMAENAMATYQAPKKESLSGDLSGILKYATT